MTLTILETLEDRDKQRFQNPGPPLPRGCLVPLFEAAAMMEKYWLPSAGRSRHRADWISLECARENI